jgi:CubicO group peptidase (beta-lactamase class C family)
MHQALVIAKVVRRSHPLRGVSLRGILATAALVLAWIAVVAIASFQGWARAPLASRGDLQAFAEAAAARIDAECAGNAVLLLIQDGKVRHEHACSVGASVDRESLFQIASVSKWVTAWGVMALVDAGRIALDVPVASYLTRWQLPESDFEGNGVTVRRLLSHTAGLTDGLAYSGFAPGERIQTLEESLTRAVDAAPHASGVVIVGREPGSRYQYSGGGYTLLQLLIEEVTGEAFESYMQRAVFFPLGMRHSTFDWRRAESSNLAELYDTDSTPAIHYRYTALAAASLYTSASELTRFVQAHFPGLGGEPIGRGVLEPDTVEWMGSPQASVLGREIHGLGPILYARSADGSFVIGHDGNNSPAINTSVRLDPATGNAIIVLVTGSSTLASRIASEWVFWLTGRVDVLLIWVSLTGILWTAAGGGVAIVFLALVLSWRRSRARGS